VQTWFDAAAPGVTPAPPFKLRPPHAGSDGNSLHLDANRFGVADVAGAVDFCTRMLGYDRGPIAYDLPSRHFQLASVQMESEKRLNQILLVQKESADRLSKLLSTQKESERRLETIHRLDERLRQSEAACAAQQAQLQQRRADSPSARALCGQLFRRLAAKLRRVSRLDAGKEGHNGG
jgi:hypothetical protein